MAAPEFYRQDGQTIAAAKQQLEKLTEELKTCYARWEQLE